VSPPDVRPLQRASAIPIQYSADESKRLAAYLEVAKDLGPKFDDFVESLPKKHDSSVEWLADVNKRIHDSVKYGKRKAAGVLSPDDTLQNGGTCRDFTWLFM